MRLTRGNRKRRPGRRRAAVVIAAAIGTTTASVPATVSATVPQTPSERPAWALSKGWSDPNVKRSISGQLPSVLLVGDSLVWGGPSQAHADRLSSATGRVGLAVASVGASYSHWIRDYLIGAVGLSPIGSYVTFLAPQITVLALGTNDARLLAEDPKYTLTDVEASMTWAVASARTKSKCVVLVNSHTRDTKFSPMIPYVNSIASKVAAKWTDGSVTVADWYAKINSNPGWYDPKDPVHHGATGKIRYQEFISSTVDARLGVAPCK